MNLFKYIFESSRKGFLFGAILFATFIVLYAGATNFDRIVLGEGNYGTDPNSTADITLQNDEFITNSTDGIVGFGAANLSTTGTFSSGAITLTTAMDADSQNITLLDTLTFVNSELIENRTNCQIGFGAANLLTTGTINTGAATLASGIITAGATVGTTLGITGVTTTTGGQALATASVVNWAKGGAVALATSGTDTTPTDNQTYWVEIEIPHNVTLTGISYLVGSVGGTDSVMVVLHNSTGVPVAWSDSTGAAVGDIVGTTAQIQSLAFETPYAAVSGRYYISTTFNGTTARFRTYPIPGSKFVTGSVGGTYGTVASITPGTTFTADKGPVCSTY